MKIKIYENPLSGAVDFLLYREVGHKVFYVKPVEFRFEEKTEGNWAVPTFTIGDNSAKEMLQELADMLDQKKIYPSTKPPLTNELIATKYHLEDMRRLVFKPKK